MRSIYSQLSGLALILAASFLLPSALRADGADVSWNYLRDYSASAYFEVITPCSHTWVSTSGDTWFGFTNGLPPQGSNSGWISIRQDNRCIPGQWVILAGTVEIPNVASINPGLRFADVDFEGALRIRKCVSEPNGANRVCTTGVAVDLSVDFSGHGSISGERNFEMSHDGGVISLFRGVGRTRTATATLSGSLDGFAIQGVVEDALIVFGSSAFLVVTAPVPGES